MRAVAQRSIHTTVPLAAKKLTPDELKKVESGTTNINFLGGYKPRGDKPPPVQPVRVPARPYSDGKSCESHD